MLGRENVLKKIKVWLNKYAKEINFGFIKKEIKVVEKRN